MATKPFKNSRGLWTIALEAPGNDSTSARPRVYVYSKDKGECIRKARAKEAELHKTGKIITSSPTVEEWMNYWLTKIHFKKVRPKTQANDVSLTKNHIIPAIGKVRLDKLRPQHIRKVHDAILATPKDPDDPSKGFLSSSTALRVHSVLSTALTAAERDGKLNGNPAKMTDAPRKAVPKLEVLTVEEANRLVDLFSKGQPERYLWAAIILTGGRRGEVLGLTWDRITDVVDFSWQLQRHKIGQPVPADYERVHVTGGLWWTRPKSSAGWRIFPLKGPLADLLSEWRTQAPSNPYNLVFTTREGQPIDPDRATELWPEVLRAAGIEKNVVIHGLRHTAVDIAYAAGIPEAVIIELFGHSAVAMSRAYRSKGNRVMLDAAAQKFSEQFQIEKGE